MKTMSEVFMIVFNFLIETKIPIFETEFTMFSLMMIGFSFTVAGWVFEMYRGENNGSN